jgi:hypothetical protein
VNDQDIIHELRVQAQEPKRDVEQRHTRLTNRLRQYLVMWWQKPPHVEDVLLDLQALLDDDA